MLKKPSMLTMDLQKAFRAQGHMGVARRAAFRGAVKVLASMLSILSM